MVQPVLFRCYTFTETFTFVEPLTQDRIERRAEGTMREVGNDDKKGALQEQSRRERNPSVKNEEQEKRMCACRI